MPASQQQIEIPLNKSKIILMMLGALAFVAIGLWFVISPPTIQNSFWGSPVKLAIIGYLAILFFGICVIYFITKLPYKRPGLIISDVGLTDNSGGLSAGEILWEDIENISVIQIHKQKLIMLHVKNPQDYIDKQTNFFKRKGMEMNLKMYGTPLSVNANGLKISFDDLLTRLTEKFQQRRANV